MGFNKQRFVLSTTEQTSLCEKATVVTKVSSSARKFILACPSGKFDVVHGGDCRPVELRVEILFAEESF